MSVPVLSVIDQVDRAKDLLRVQATHEHAPTEEPVRTQSEDDGQQDGWLLGDRGDGRRDTGQQVVGGRVATDEAEPGR